MRTGRHLFVCSLFFGFAALGSMVGFFQSCGTQDRDMIEAAQTPQAVVSTTHRWESNVIPFVYGTGIERRHEALIESAMDIWSQNVDLVFVQRTHQSDYVVFESILQANQDDLRCSSRVGRAGGPQKIRIDRHSSGWDCMNTRTIMHEIGHALGLHHEHTRIDQSAHVILNRENSFLSDERWNINFVSRQASSAVDIGEFDADSIMLYSSYAFAEEGKGPTITLKDGRLISSNPTVSAGDRMAVANLFHQFNQQAINRSWAPANRDASEFCSRARFARGFFNGHQNLAPNFQRVFGILCLERSSLELALLPKPSENWTSPGDFYRAAHDHCSRVGAAGGFPSGGESGSSFEVICIKPTAGQTLQAPDHEFGLGGVTLQQDWARYHRAGNDWCQKRGFSSGRLNMHMATAANGQRVLGVVCLNDSSVHYHQYWSGR